MKDIRKGTCPLCLHDEIVESTSAHMHLANSVTGDGRDVTGLIGLARHGKIRLYACRRCGLTQSFADDVSSVPIGEKHGTRLIKGPESEGPYR